MGMMLEYDYTDLMNSRLYGGYLIENLAAIGFLINHPLHPPDLAFNAFQSGNNLFSFFCLHLITSIYP